MTKYLKIMVTMLYVIMKIIITSIMTVIMIMLVAAIITILITITLTIIIMTIWIITMIKIIPVPIMTIPPKTGMATKAQKNKYIKNKPSLRPQPQKTQSEGIRSHISALNAFTPVVA